MIDLLSIKSDGNLDPNAEAILLGRHGSLDKAQFSTVLPGRGAYHSPGNKKYRKEIICPRVLEYGRATSQPAKRQIVLACQESLNNGNLTVLSVDANGVYDIMNEIGIYEKIRHSLFDTNRIRQLREREGCQQHQEQHREQHDQEPAEHQRQSQEQEQEQQQQQQQQQQYDSVNRPPAVAFQLEPLPVGDLPLDDETSQLAAFLADHFATDDHLRLDFC